MLFDRARGSRGKVQRARPGLREGAEHEGAQFRAGKGGYDAQALRQQRLALLIFVLLQGTLQYAERLIVPAFHQKGAAKIVVRVDKIRLELQRWLKMGGG